MSLGGEVLRESSAKIEAAKWGLELINILILCSGYTVTSSKEML